MAHLLTSFDRGKVHHGSMNHETVQCRLWFKDQQEMGAFVEQQRQGVEVPTPSHSERYLTKWEPFFTKTKKELKAMAS